LPSGLAAHHRHFLRRARYGMLLGSFGLGALLGALALPRLRENYPSMAVVGAAILIFAAMTFAAGRAENFILLCACCW